MKKSRILVSLALAAIMFLMTLMSIIPAFAAGEDDDDGGNPNPSSKQMEGTETDPALAAITKLLQVPYGTAVPQTTFEFTVTPISVDGDDDGNVVATMPVIGDNGIVSIEFPDANGYTHTEPDKDGNGIDYYYLESSELFTNSNITWPHAGAYVYEITEVNGTFGTNSSYPIAPYDLMTYSVVKYTVTVLVKDGTNGNTYVFYVGAMKTTKEDGQDGTEKVDPTPGKETQEFEYSQMIFINTYVKANGGTDPEDDNNWTLSISKVVSGDFASSTIYFKYDLTINTPSLLNEPNASYKGYVVEEDPNTPTGYKNVTSEDNGAAPGANHIVFDDGTLTTFYLKDGQYLVFIDTPVGTTYEIKEYGTAGYAPSVIVTYDDDPGLEETGTKGADLELPYANNSVYTDTLYVGEGKNSADFKNTNNTTIPTGLDLNDLPFIGMIILATGGFITFIAFKARKTKATAKNAAVNYN